MTTTTTMNGSSTTHQATSNKATGDSINAGVYPEWVQRCTPNEHTRAKLMLLYAAMKADPKITYAAAMNAVRKDKRFADCGMMDAYLLRMVHDAAESGKTPDWQGYIKRNAHKNNKREFSGSVYKGVKGVPDWISKMSPTEKTREKFVALYKFFTSNKSATSVDGSNFLKKNFDGSSADGRFISLIREGVESGKEPNWKKLVNHIKAYNKVRNAAYHNKARPKKAADSKDLKVKGGAASVSVKTKVEHSHLPASIQAALDKLNLLLKAAGFNPVRQVSRTQEEVFVVNTGDA